jgi:HTH-type transcriptional regulator / antitoxin HigA
MTSRTAETFPPGDILAEELEARGWSQADLVAIIGRDSGLVSAIIAGKRAITVETARDLAGALGTTPQFWINLQAAYQLGQLEDAGNEVARRARLFEIAPINEMFRRGWIEKSDNVTVLERRVTSFFQMKDLSEEPEFWPIAARKSQAYDEPETVLRAWLFRARQLAKSVYVDTTYTPQRLASALATLKGCLEYPNEIRRVPRILSDHGIRLVVVEKLSKSHVDGVCFWLDRNSPVVALSMRFDRLDYFWHTLIHELDHVGHGDGKARGYASVDSNWGSERGDKPEEEIRADAFASGFTVDQAKLESFIRRVKPLFSALRIEAFAKRLNTHPGLVVGQLQYRGEIPYSHSRRLLVKVRQHLIGAALTDGFGHQPPVVV